MLSKLARSALVVWFAGSACATEDREPDVAESGGVYTDEGGDDAVDDGDGDGGDGVDEGGDGVDDGDGGDGADDAGDGAETEGGGDGADGGADDGGPGPAGTCGAGGPTGSIVQVTLGSPERYYLLGAPATDEPLPVVLAFHGDEGDPEEAVRWFWTPVWEAHQDFIIVMMKCPGCESWYMGDTDANADYVWEVLTDVSNNHNVDVSRVYAVGYSGGSSFLAAHGLEFQEVFAGIQWNCGGGGWNGYTAPPRPDCKVDARFVISEDDFLWDSAKQMEQLLLDNGHLVDFVIAQCSGHCCHTDDLAEGAWAWFQQRTKCGGVVGGDCGELTDLP